MRWTLFFQSLPPSLKIESTSSAVIDEVDRAVARFSVMVGGSLENAFAADAFIADWFVFGADCC